MINHAREASEHLSDLNAFSMIIAIAESGCFYRKESRSALTKIIKLARSETMKRLSSYDVEIEMTKIGGVQ